MSINDQDWVVILNPNAGKRLAAKKQKMILDLLEKYKIKHQLVVTEKCEDAIHLTQKYIANGQRKFIGVGGDGTANEIVNGIFYQDKVHPHEITFAFIPVGSGNDWVKTIGIDHESIENAIKTIKIGNFFLHDVGKVTVRNNTESKVRYFVNIAGFCYDAFVCQRMQTKKSRSYKLLVFSSLLKYKQSKLTLSIDEQVAYEGTCFSMAIGHGKYNGKGMMQLPHAMPDDGIFDITLYKQVGKMDVIKNQSKLYDGSFLNLPFINSYTAKQCKIIGEEDVLVETDGEYVGAGKVDIEMQSRALKLIAEIKNRQE